MLQADFIHDAVLGHFKKLACVLCTPHAVVGIYVAMRAHKEAYMLAYGASMDTSLKCVRNIVVPSGFFQLDKIIKSRLAKFHTCSIFLHTCIQHSAESWLTPMRVAHVVAAGPVRGVHFHKNQPLIVSGGDDYKIKVRMRAALRKKKQDHA